MKKILYSVLILLPVIFISCEEDFSPKTDFKPKYALSCVIRGDTTYQTLTLSKSYMVDGYDPFQNHDDPALYDADIRLWQKDDVYFFKDSSIERTDKSRYNTPQGFYYVDNFVPVENSPIQIRVITSNGKTLWGSTVLPQKVTWDTSSNFILPPKEGSTFLFQWVPKTNYGWYLMRYSIAYKNAAIGNQTFRVQVPLRFNGETPEYPKPTKKVGYVFENSALQKVFADISKNDPVKSNYTIFGGIIELIIFDEHLSKYFSSLNGFFDDLTIRVDQTDYTNIEGGIGIFGSYLKQNNGNIFTEDYIRSFGYKSGI
jgi:hypothetical protein